MATATRLKTATQQPDVHAFSTSSTDKEVLPKRNIWR